MHDTVSVVFCSVFNILAFDVSLGFCLVKVVSCLCCFKYHASKISVLLFHHHGPGTLVPETKKKCGKSGKFWYWKLRNSFKLSLGLNSHINFRKVHISWDAVLLLCPHIHLDLLQKREGLWWVKTQLFICVNFIIRLTTCFGPFAGPSSGHKIYISLKHVVSLTFRHRASCILGQAFHYSPENVFYIFNQQIYFIIWYLLDCASLI